MRKTLYVLYTPNVGDGDMQGPYHSIEETIKPSKTMVSQIKAGNLEEGTVKIIDEDYNDVKQVYPVL